jgi:hypothetical protein
MFAIISSDMMFKLLNIVQYGAWFVVVYRFIVKSINNFTVVW